MRTFTDAGGREWKILVTVASVEQVRKRCEVMLPALFDDSCKPMGKLASDAEKLVQVLWVLCESQAEHKPFKDEISGEQKDKTGPADFGSSLYGDALGAAWEALVRSTCDFFTSPDQRATAHATLDKINEMARAFTTGALAMMQSIDGPLMGTSMLNSVTNGLASPVLTQDQELPAS